MKTANFIKEFIQSTLQLEVDSIDPILGLGQVNQLFDVRIQEQPYILRFNDDPAKQLEYKKEAWCIDQMQALGIPSPRILQLVFQAPYSLMLQDKIPGINGTLCTPQEQATIWQALGSYAAQFHQIPKIEQREVEEQEFHANWAARLHYNLKELDRKEDSLRSSTSLSSTQHQAIKTHLSSLLETSFQYGLVHGDLCPRNVLWKNGTTYLLDWGTAEINVVPHHEIALVFFSNEASDEAFRLFLAGLGWSYTDFKQEEKTITLLYLLHRLDKYRWAESYDREALAAYEMKVLEVLEKLYLL